MKSESEFCTVIKNSMIDGQKWPDPSGQFAATIQRAYDGCGLLQEEDGLHYICWEAKFLKNLQAFSLKRVEAHQHYFLKSHGRAVGVRAYLIVGFDVSRNDKRAYVFDYDENMQKLYIEGHSFHKDKLEKLPYNKITKGAFEFENIIRKEDIDKAYVE